MNYDEAKELLTFIGPFGLIHLYFDDDLIIFRFSRGSSLLCLISLLMLARFRRFMLAFPLVSSSGFHYSWSSLWFLFLPNILVCLLFRACSHTLWLCHMLVDFNLSRMFFGASWSFEPIIVYELY